MEGGDKWLVTSPDPVKDQTDFLAQIESWQLKKSDFPIGHHIKNEVREIAEEEHLINAKRKDSQGICFLGQINYNDYIRRYLGEKPGDVIEMETGKRRGAKIRHTPEYHPATIEKLEDGSWMIHSPRRAIHGVAPGQFCVVYDENFIIIALLWFRARLRCKKKREYHQHFCICWVLLYFLFCFRHFCSWA